MVNKFHYKYLPAYAAFLLKNKVREFTVEQLKLLSEFNIFKSTDLILSEEIIQAGIENTILFLSDFNTINSGSKYFPETLLAYKFPFLNDEKISQKDIINLSFILRKLFRDFLNSYTTDHQLTLQIIEEVDRYTIELDAACFNQLAIVQGKEINEKQNFIRKIAEITPTIITVYNIHSGKYIFVNNAIRSILGYDKNEVMEQGVNFIISKVHPDDLVGLMEKNMAELEKANLEENRNEEIIVEFLYRLKHKNGEYRWFNTYGTIFRRDNENKVEELLNVSVDITDEVNAIEELIRTNEALSASEERYQNMISQVQDYSIVLLSKAGIIENWNKGAQNIKGYDTEEIIGKHFSIFYAEEDQQKNLPQQLLDFAALKGKANHEGWRIRKDGERYWGATVITSIYDKEGEIIGFTKVTRDLTDKKIAEDQLKEYSRQMELNNKKLAQANKELESFNFVASHDLQEPLRKIQAFTSRLLQKEHHNLSDWGKEVFDKIQFSANRMQKLIEALLNFSKLDKYEEEFVPTDLNLLLQESKYSLAQMIEEKKAIIESEDLPILSVIPVQFQQLLTNLLHNALKYSKPNIPSRINISFDTIDAKDHIDTHGFENLKFQRIQIKDNGIGFEQQYSEKIFELFQRLHGKTEYEGTGIGLSICKKIIENHRGIITAKGEPGIGSVFNIYFPHNKN
jgi:PAS domain S-box-containing protein